MHALIDKYAKQKAKAAPMRRVFTSATTPRIP
jgi:hypothetical protein